ncbi:MAG: phytoene desaturase [Archangium sp.]|nr:phytoene desaturase [Archangium sp.]
MKTKRVAVIGGGLGGLTAAGELSRAGHHVTLFERGLHLGGKAQTSHVDGFTLDAGPTLLTLPAVVREGFERLGALDLLPRFIELPLQCDYRWDDGAQLQLHRELDAAAASAERVRAGEGDALRRFYETAATIYRAAGEPYLEAPFVGGLDFMRRVVRRGLGALWSGARLSTLDDLAAQHFASPQLRQFVGRFATYAGASPFEASAAFALIPHLERAFGVHHVEGGMGALSRALALALERLGVVVNLGVSATWRAEGAQFFAGPAGGEEQFDAVVVNADPLVASPRPEEPLALSGYVLHLGVDRRVSLPHHTVRFARNSREEFTALFDGQMPEDLTLYVCHPAATDPQMAPKGQSGLFVMVNAPALEAGPDDSSELVWAVRAEGLRERCVAQVRALSAELAGARIRVLDERTPIHFARTGAPGGSIYGFLPHGRFGPFRRPRMRSSVPGLFFAGGGTHPGGGVPLVMLSGHFAAQLAAQHLEARA